MENIFVDTSAFVALYALEDQYNKSAIEKLKRLSERPHRLVTSSYILDETLTNLLRREGYRAALKFGLRIFEETSDFQIIRIDETIESEAWRVFKTYNKDKRWSFTDCTSYVVMKSMAIKSVFTFDIDDFRQMGFQLL